MVIDFHTKCTILWDYPGRFPSSKNSHHTITARHRIVYRSWINRINVSKHVRQEGSKAISCQDVSTNKSTFFSGIKHYWRSGFSPNVTGTSLTFCLFVRRNIDEIGSFASIQIFNIHLRLSESVSSPGRMVLKGDTTLNCNFHSILLNLRAFSWSNSIDNCCFSYCFFVHCKFKQMFPECSSVFC